jgi:hypothetical protein
MRTSYLAAAVLAAVTTTGQAADTYSPYLNRQGMEQVYWGDTHLHTA